MSGGCKSAGAPPSPFSFFTAFNLDTTSEEATTFLKRSPFAAQHLYQPGGLEGKLATDYGIQVLPQVFLVGKDGKVVGKNLQISTVEEEIKKSLK